MNSISILKLCPEIFTLNKYNLYINIRITLKDCSKETLLVILAVLFCQLNRKCTPTPLTWYICCLVYTLSFRFLTENAV